MTTILRVGLHHWVEHHRALNFMNLKIQVQCFIPHSHPANNSSPMFQIIWMHYLGYSFLGGRVNQGRRMRKLRTMLECSYYIIEYNLTFVSGSETPFLIQRLQILLPQPPDNCCGLKSHIFALSQFKPISLLLEWNSLKPQPKNQPLKWMQWLA